MNKSLEDLNLEEGTIEFWVKKDKIQWNDGLIEVLVNLTISMVEKKLLNQRSNIKKGLN